MTDEHNLHNKQTEKKQIVSRNVYLNVRAESSESVEIAKPKIKLTQVHAYNKPECKRLHSRIVKMLVGGGKPKTKFICYPDSSDYQRIWQK